MSAYSAVPRSARFLRGVVFIDDDKETKGVIQVYVGASRACNYVVFHKYGSGEVQFQRVGGWGYDRVAHGLEVIARHLGIKHESYGQTAVIKAIAEWMHCTPIEIEAAYYKEER